MLEILWNLRGEEREILEAATDILNHNNTLVQCLVIVNIVKLWSLVSHTEWSNMSERNSNS